MALKPAGPWSKDLLAGDSGKVPKRTAQQIHASRSQKARIMDESLKAPLAKNEEEWKKNPNRLDLPYVDTPRPKASDELGKKSLNTPNDQIVSGEKMATQLESGKRYRFTFNEQAIWDQSRGINMPLNYRTMTTWTYVGETEKDYIVNGFDMKGVHIPKKYVDNIEPFVPKFEMKNGKLVRNW